MKFLLLVLVGISPLLAQRKVIERPEIKYPPLARLGNIEGAVYAFALIDEGGQISETSVKVGPRLLRQAVEDNLRLWKFDKADKKTQIHLEVIFKLGDQKSETFDQQKMELTVRDKFIHYNNQPR